MCDKESRERKRDGTGVEGLEINPLKQAGRSGFDLQFFAFEVERKRSLTQTCPLSEVHESRELHLPHPASRIVPCAQ